jgi:hypothetical protein
MAAGRSPFSEVPPQTDCQPVTPTSWPAGYAGASRLRQVRLTRMGLDDARIGRLTVRRSEDPQKAERPFKAGVAATAGPHLLAKSAAPLAADGGSEVIHTHRCGNAKVRRGSAVFVLPPRWTDRTALMVGGEAEGSRSSQVSALAPRYAPSAARLKLFYSEMREDCEREHRYDAHR